MQDQRINPRYPLRWRAALRVPAGQMLYGGTVDVSIGGVSVLLEQNIVYGTMVSLFLQIPPPRVGAPPLVIETRAKVLYTAFSADHDRWRLGVQFLDFDAEHRKRLEKELSRHG